MLYWFTDDDKKSKSGKKDNSYDKNKTNEKKMKKKSKKDPFKIFDDVKDKDVKKPKIDTSGKGIEDLLDGFDNFFYHFKSNVTDGRYDEALKIVKNIEYEISEVEKLCNDIPKQKDSYNANINELMLFGKLSTEFLMAAVNHKIKKNDDVHLDISKYNHVAHMGMRMTKGKLIVKGNHFLNLGYQMHGGILELHGNAGLDVGHHMDGGWIRVFGPNVMLSGQIYSGDIYLNGQHMFGDDGK